MRVPESSDVSKGHQINSNRCIRIGGVKLTIWTEAGALRGDWVHLIQPYLESRSLRVGVTETEEGIETAWILQTSDANPASIELKSCSLTAEASTCPPKPMYSPDPPEQNSSHSKRHLFPDLRSQEDLQDGSVLPFLLFGIILSTSASAVVYFISESFFLALVAYVAFGIAGVLSAVVSNLLRSSP